MQVWRLRQGTWSDIANRGYSDEEWTLSARPQSLNETAIDLEGATADEINSTQALQ